MSPHCVCPGRWRSRRLFAAVVLVCLAASAGGGIAVEDPNAGQTRAKPFALIVPQDEIDDAIIGQRCVFPVTIIEEGSGAGAGEPVKLSAVLLGQLADTYVTVEPNAIRPGEVAELTIVPREPNDVDPNDRIPLADRPVVDPIEPEEPELERQVIVELLAERADVRRSKLIEVNVLPGEDLLGETPAFYRDLFVPWLAVHHAELGITAETQWVGTIVKPHILVVTYYLYYSADWELGLRWHVMIPPYDWAEIYLRRRGELSSTRAWRIGSVVGQLEPAITELPTEGIFR